ncbi:sensor histidine kinase [Paenibacillus prosopidis]|uniref:histidine kinase n=1 Tax=Paenibacillus prosopidis TaxID=630520 RepID=A0A368W404_9BACL|nr:histidine kinase [Paenibacillus prosopidis]RCW49018.1 two-component system sensor histidine kinase YesM [Paenibacillus prosopidis]
MIRLNIFKLIKRPYSLRNRLLVILPLTALTPLILIGSISYYSMHSILENKTKAGILSHLHEVRISLDNTLRQLNHVSQQLAYDGVVGKNLENYLISKTYEKKKLEEEIEKEISMISFTNPDLGLIFYYSNQSGKHFFENFPVNDTVNIDRLPQLMKANLITYFGPHLSLNSLDGRLVFSAIRPVKLDERDDIYVYMETSYKRIDSILGSRDDESGYLHLIVDDQGRIAYSEEKDAFPVGDAYPVMDSSGERAYNGYYAFEENNNQSWKVVTLIRESAYKFEINRWIGQFSFFAVISIAVSCLFAGLLWRTLYHPLRNLILDIRAVKNRKLIVPVRQSDNLEFNLIHGELEHMRLRIANLIDEIAYNEKQKAELEVEKLMNQINPHFLLNTLDTIRWMARSEGQFEIDRLISMLNKLLHYNLGKDGEASINDELEAVANYVRLQEVRYHVNFQVHVQVDSRVMDQNIPRFILQPLVENALYHGLDGDGVIEVEIKQHENAYLLITVKDNGHGMSEEQMGQLMQSKQDKSGKLGMGIGLQYVIRMLKTKYGDQASFHISSEVGRHTTVTLKLPILIKGDAFYEKSVSGG